MDVSEVRDRLDRTCDFPVDHGDLVDQYGDLELDAPTGTRETLEAVLARTNESAYDSPAALHATLLTSVGEAHVGRPRYDDRAGVRARPADRQVVSV